MIKEINQACEALNERLGISVPLPNPGKKALEKAAACHFAVGAGMTAAGIAFTSKWCAALGGAGIISGLVLRREGKRREDGRRGDYNGTVTNRAAR